MNKGHQSFRSSQQPVRKKPWRYPIFAAINTLAGTPEFQRYKKLSHSTLHSRNLNFSNWNLKNLEVAMQNGESTQGAVLFAETHTLKPDAIEIALRSEESNSLSELLAICSSRYPTTTVFLDATQTGLKETVDCIDLSRYKNVFLTVFVEDQTCFFFTLACELANLWGMTSCTTAHTNVDEYFQIIDALIDSYAQQIPGCSYATNSTIYSNDKLWSNGDINFCEFVDIEKLRTPHRQEQVDDTMKRILDAASHPKPEHATRPERAISSQGLFWLAQIHNAIDVDNWITQTRFYLTLHPSHQESDDAYRKFVRSKPKADYDILAIASILDDVTYIPKKLRHFGREVQTVDSEPANVISAELPAFWISKFLVSKQQWNSLFESDSSLRTVANFPKTNCNFFEAHAFCELLTSRLEEILTKKFCEGARIGVPSEYQWEAAAAGENTKDYPWGNSFDPDACNSDMRYGSSTPIGYFSPQGDSEFGCADMAGNVREWTSSYAGTRGLDWASHTADRPLDTTPPSYGQFSRLVIKGGSYSYGSECVQTWVRNTQIASRKDHQTGFRIAVILPEES